jgi:hypothetical protein
MTKTKPPNPGIYPDVPDDEYHAWDAVNQSAIKEGVYSMRRMRHALDGGDPPTDAMIFGTALHTYCLQPENMLDDYIAAPKVDRRTKAGKEKWAQFQTTAAGKTIVDEDQLAMMRAMRARLKANDAAARLLWGEGGQSELSAVWRDPGSGVLCKLRADRLVSDSGPVVICGDLKSTRAGGADPRTFARSAATFGYHIQAAFYLDGLCTLLGKDPNHALFYIIAAEKHTEAGDVAVYYFDFRSVERGREIYKRVLADVAVCQQMDSWGGYPQTEQPLTLPPWVFYDGDAPEGDF